MSPTSIYHVLAFIGYRRLLTNVMYWSGEGTSKPLSVSKLLWLDDTLIAQIFNGLLKVSQSGDPSVW